MANWHEKVEHYYCKVKWCGLFAAWALLTSTYDFDATDEMQMSVKRGDKLSVVSNFRCSRRHTAGGGPSCPVAVILRPASASWPLILRTRNRACRSAARRLRATRLMNCWSIFDRVHNSCTAADARIYGRSWNPLSTVIIIMQCSNSSALSFFLQKFNSEIYLRLQSYRPITLLHGDLSF